MNVGARLSTDWTYRGFKTIILENEEARLTVLPEYGAKILEFVLKKRDKDLMYHNPRVEIRTPVYGVNVDNWWHGGFDECIPTNQPSTYRGEEYPFLGELWPLTWDYEVEKNHGEEVTLHMWRRTVIAPLQVDRWMTLRDHGSVLQMRHRVSNIGYSDFQFLWGLHSGPAINPSTRIDLPDPQVMIDESTPNNRLGARGDSYIWPNARTSDGKTVDMRIVQPPETKTMDFHYATELKEGWLAVTDASAKVGLGHVFPKEIFRCIYLWLVYGGFRGLHCMVIMPCTGYPAKLDQAVKNGIFTTLDSGESLTCETRLVGYSDISKVDRINPEGIVEGS